MNRYQLTSLAGTFVLAGAAWAISKNRSRIKPQTILWSLLLQFAFAFLIMKTSAGERSFSAVNKACAHLLAFEEEGARFVFGTLALSPGEPGSTGFYFAFQVLPTIIFLSSLMSLLYYLGVMQKIVQGFAWIMARTCRTSGAESLSISANIFMGQTEAPLLIRPYIESMTESELFCVMVGGMAHIAAGIMIAYVGMLSPYFPDIAGHLLAAQLMATPATILIAKLLIPEAGAPKTMGSVKIGYHEESTNAIEAAAAGGSLGMTLALNVAAMLVAFMSIIALVNWGLHHLLGLFGHGEIGLETLLGWIFAPVAWILGVPWSDCLQVGQWMGEKTAFNEFIAYSEMARYAAAHGAQAISHRAYVIAVHALCGFSNFLSIGIQIGGIGPMAPARRKDLARLGLLALFGGSLACFMTASITGILIP